MSIERKRREKIEGRGKRRKRMPRVGAKGGRGSGSLQGIVETWMRYGKVEEF